MSASGGGFFRTSEGSRSEAFGPLEWGLLLGVAAIWGSSYFWIELGLRGLHPGVVAVARLTLGLIAVLLVPASRRPIAREDRVRVVALGVGWITLPMVLFPFAQSLGVASSLVGMLNGAMPLIATLFAALLLRRPPGARQIAGVSLGLVGLAVIAGPRIMVADAASIGVLMILFSMSVNALFASVLVPLQQRYGALPVLRWAMSTALVIALPFGIHGSLRSAPTVGSLLAMLPLGILSTGLAFVMWATLVGRAGATRGSVVSYLVPVVAILLGVGVLGESIARSELIGMTLVLAGAWLISGREPRRREAVAAEHPDAPVH
jgi:drug/metabolite transporter (DMT)-like permease